MRALTLLLATLAAAPAAGGVQRPVPSHEVDPSRRPGVHEVARINGARLMSDRLDAAVAALIPMESFHRNVDPEKLKVLRQRALQTIIDDELAHQEAVRQGVTVPESALLAAWKQSAVRYGGEKGFDAALRAAGASRALARAEMRRSIAIKTIIDREITAKCRVGQDQAATFFKANPDRFVEPEQLHLYAITVGVDPSSAPAKWAAARKLAEQALRDLEAGASFGDTALKYSTDPSKARGGDMGFMHRGSLSDQFERAVKDVPAGRFSPVIETLYGYHVILVSETRPPQKKSFADVRANLEKDLTTTRCAEMQQAWVNRLRARAVVVIAEHAP
ncbi:MAG: peptidylprolyl isomerase [Vicinamibacterales bacterium]